MKLKNKKTGEIDDFIFEVITDRIDLYRRVGHSATKNIWHYNSLAELNEEWEDFEEPKEYWFIYGNQVLKNECDGVIEDRFKEIGNYFSSREKAEKAVEKLEAWKRLKDKGFKLKGWYMPKSTLKIEIDGGFPEDVSLCDVMDDLDIIFGGEE